MVGLVMLERGIRLVVDWLQVVDFQDGMIVLQRKDLSFWAPQWHACLRDQWFIRIWVGSGVTNTGSERVFMNRQLIIKNEWHYLANLWLVVPDHGYFELKKKTVTGLKMSRVSLTWYVDGDERRFVSNGLSVNSASRYEGKRAVNVESGTCSREANKQRFPHTSLKDYYVGCSVVVEIPSSLLSSSTISYGTLAFAFGFGVVVLDLTLLGRLRSQIFSSWFQ